ncbi:MAG: 16S rRNA (uracil(1498)-N(3))-methyltransferase [Capnocytophaga sp.]|nr:16S rRNA (uracil(1498)-N(3))-methyltransferase [Capnocytophaga sp.]
MQLFYHLDIHPDTASVSFDKEESTHIVKVLRRKEGDTLHITNGLGWLFEGEIVFASPKRCEVRIVRKEGKPKHPYHLHMAVAPTKMNERYEWFLEKAVEMGVDEITPVICRHSERTVVKTERFEKIILSAMKQSLRFHLPKLNPPTNISDFFEKEISENSQRYIAHCQEDKRILFSKKIKTDTPDITVLIGPEGDFSADEIRVALSLEYIPISLGDYRLRTETAAIAACHTVAVIHEVTTAKNYTI